MVGGMSRGLPENILGSLMVKLPTRILDKLNKIKEVEPDEFEETSEELETELERKQKLRDSRSELRRRERARQNANRQIKNRK
jgi:hypothetical protein